ncbi:FecCD family ABC transporter permease [Arthrobacter sp. UM1]|uniref:FecCD family ABC transporter permease n=1 Tax=Arthrobacter sp. UM1 TaxID=2766776 RepID=UPI001CF62F7F|nr:iron chelate uptake ABC transporter family permease subunit [Arthrobacter sp. UM1]
MTRAPAPPLPGRFRVRLGPVSRLGHTRSLWTTAALLLAGVALLGATLLWPGAGVTPSTALGALTGEDAGFSGTVVLQWRLPRALSAAAVGAALAVSGALFQALTRNPLGSPDIIGFNTGAYTGVLTALLLGHSGFGAVSLGALIGGAAAAAAVGVLSWKQGFDGLRLILVGLGVSMMLSAFNRWLILRGDQETALSAATWGAGTLNGIRWESALPACALLALLLALSAGAGRTLSLLGLGDESATALGLPRTAPRLLLLAAGVLLTAVCTALAGPISFIALAAPHIAQRLTRSPRPHLASTAAAGAALLLLADLCAQRLFAPVQLPVGLVTVTLGGLYLMALLASRQRRPSLRPVSAPSRPRSPHD